jgi:acetyl-CoA carboxylase biotin carboxyl carrier protein
MSDGSSDPIDTRLVRRLAAILKETDLTEIEVEQGALKIRVARQVSVAQPAAATPVAMAAPEAAPAPPPTAPSAGSTESLPAGETVKSPMVGTVYLQSQPSSPPFVTIGDRIEAGQTLLIIEAMKTMNPIAAPKGGVVRAILVTDGQPVEYGQPLAVVE